LLETPSNHTVETFTASDGYRCHYRRYVPAAERAKSPRAHVVCLHGIQSHAGWYEHSCTRLSQAGYLVSFLDRRGAGLNEQDRGDTPSYRRLLDDIAEFLEAREWERERAKGRESQVVQDKGAATLPLAHTATLPLSQSSSPAQLAPLPVFLLAISWGGKLAVAVQHQHPGYVDGLVLLCPGFYPRVGPALSERLQIAWARLVSPRRLFPVPLQDAELFTATPRWQQFIRDDPLSLRRATARFFAASVFLDRALRSKPQQVDVPVLLLLAGKDRVIDNHLTRRFVDQFATDDKETKAYPEAAHTLEFEADPNPFVEDIRGWLDRHCPVS
jgi:alpha-beta hydrolase superfamily lysophospholipase